MSKAKVYKINVTVNHQRQPILRNVKRECCPTCKQPLSWVEAVNDVSGCKCGEWWFVMKSPFEGTSKFDDSGWHFKATEVRK